MCKSKAAMLFYGMTALIVGGSVLDFTGFFGFVPL
jgi:hypothetical protein